MLSRISPNLLSTVSGSGVKRPPFLRTLKPAEFGELRRRRGHVLSVGALGLRWGQHWGRARGLGVVPAVAIRAAAAWFWYGRRPGLAGLLLSASLLLPQQLLSLQEDAGVEAGRSQVAVMGSLHNRVARVLLGRGRFLSWRVHLVPWILGRRAGALTRRPEHTETGKESVSLLRESP